MPEFIVEGGFNDRMILEGFKKITAAGEQAGQQIGKALDQAAGKKLEIKADPRSIVMMRERVEELRSQLERVKVGSTAFRELSAQVRTAEASLNRATAASQGLSKSLGGIGSSLGGQLAGLASIAGVGALLKGAIDRAVELETITRKLSNTLGPQGAAGALSFTKGLADQLGLSYTTLASTFGGFTAAASAANVPIETQRGLFAAVAKSAQALGLSNDELRGSLLALQQIASKGTVSMEELRGQLGERLPIAFGAAAKGLGVTQQQLIKLVESGRLTAGEFFPALTKGLNDLTASSGGAETSAQSFEKLGNAWAELQASFGTSLLPGIVKQVQDLAGALEGIGVAQEAEVLGLGTRFGLLGKVLGDVPVQGAQAVGALKAVQNQYGLTAKEARELFANAAQSAGATKNAQGQLNLTTEQYEKILARLPELAREFRAANPDQNAQRLAEAAAAAKLAEKLQRALDIDKARARAVGQLNALRAQEPVRRLDDQLAVGTQLNSLAAAASGLEMSRFATVRARVQFEIDNAERLGITQEGIAARKAQQDEIQKQALIAQFQALLLQQQVEQALLTISQKRAALDAQAAVFTAQETAARARLAVIEAQRTGNGTAIGEAIEAARLAAEQVGIAQQRVALLEKIAPIEVAIGKATAETARQQLLAQGAALGIERQLEGIAANAGAATGEIKDLGRGFIQVGAQVKTFGDSKIDKVTDDAAGSARSFAGSMDDAAGSAQRLLQYLSAASGLSPARFTGGPVEAGGRYRINDGPGGRSLGQESFLSRAGDLSLIKNPANSLWTAPAPGIVLPAAVTDVLKQRGAFAAGGGVARRAAAAAGGIRPAGAPNTARLELAITSLRAEVKALREKQWTVQQRVTNSPGSTQVRLLTSIL